MFQSKDDQQKKKPEKNPDPKSTVSVYLQLTSKVKISYSFSSFYAIHDILHAFFIGEGGGSGGSIFFCSCCA